MTSMNCVKYGLRIPSSVVLRSHSKTTRDRVNGIPHLQRCLAFLSKNHTCFQESQKRSNSCSSMLDRALDKFCRKKIIKSSECCHSGSILKYSTDASVKTDVVDYLDCSDNEIKAVMLKDMQVVYDFVTEDEERQLFEEIEPHLKRLRYESSHWDDAIHGYRETERKTWTERNKQIIQKVRDIAFPPGVPQLAYVHVLDLKKDGHIKPHVDAVKFCGSTIAGISLLSPAVMRLVHTEDKSKFADVLLERRSLYIMKDAARYSYTHEVLAEEKSLFKGKKISKDRRISVICRNEP